MTFMLLTCSGRYEVSKNRYSFQKPPGWESYSRDKRAVSVPEDVDYLINKDAADVVFYKGEKTGSLSLIYFLTYNSYLNISTIADNQNIKNELLDQLVAKYGNGRYTGSSSGKIGRVLTTSIFFTFNVLDYDYSYRMTFISGSISSTQGIYSLFPSSEINEMNKQIDDIIASYSKY